MVTIEVTPMAEGEISNTATVAGNERDPDPADNMAMSLKSVGLNGLAWDNHGTMTVNAGTQDAALIQISNL